MPLKLLLHAILLLKFINGGVAFIGVLRPRASRAQTHHSFRAPKETAKQTAPTPKLPPHFSRNNGSDDRGNPIDEKNEDGSATTVASQAALIAGTTIGGGFLALPAATAPCGAAPSALGLIGVWFFLLGGALSLTDAIFMMKRNGHEADRNDISVFSLVRECFGGAAGILSGLIFLLLVKVTLIAQLSKVGLLLEESLLIMDRRFWTTLFSISITILCLVSNKRKIERINDALTAVMLLSFASLVTLAGGSGWSLDGLKRAEYKSLLPSILSGTSSNCVPWAIPIFIQLLIYNEVVPLVSSRLGDERKVRRAILFGSSVPLVMCLVWSCVALGLVPYEPSTVANGIIYDPLTALGGTVSSKGGPVGKLFLASVNMLAVSAICTTAIGSILASTQYFDDMITNFRSGRGIGSRYWNVTNEKGGHEVDIRTNSRNVPSKYRKLMTHTLAVAPSAVVALRGSGDLYYRATSFAGEFPCTLLYGLIPPLCNLRMLWKHRNNLTENTTIIHGKGVILQTTLAIVSLVILLASGVSA